MTNRTLIAVVLAVTMVLAGCSTGTNTGTTAPTDDTTTAETTVATTTEADSTTTSADSSDDTTTAEPTTTTEDYPEVKTENCRYSGEGDDDIVRESGACLPFDADEVYKRVADMADIDIDKGPSVNSIPARETSRYDFNFNNDTFGATMGIAPDGQPSVFVPGYASPNSNPDGTVSPAVTMRYIGLWNDTALQEELGIRYTAADAEVTAAHEFLHVMQFYQGSQERLAQNLSSEGVNLADVELAMVEGSASFFESQYQREYMDNPDAMRNFSAWSNANAYSMKQLGPYVAGSHYTRWYLNGSTENFEKIYDNPPKSMEQILHKHPPDEELPKNLSVNGEVSSEWATPSSAETKGELFLRSALRSGVSGDDAAAGAAGWGQDGAIAFQNTSYSAAGNYKYGYGWAIRFDNATEAAEFETIFQEWLESKGPQENGVYGESDDQTFRMIEISEETVVVLAGHEDFTTQATASGDTTAVVIEHTGENQTQSDAVTDDGDDEDDESTVAGSVHVRPLA
ncbi:hypothetical protein G9C85_05995 [Halorubellus sp. JP-L1]|uniref:hypothetical protein n=1 Tax=Halorubellus sp. JP-L1 TaxID=2715753 RepID=UPI00140AA386|nr:hypothetical protein [Halorubellus sp. JP-L1]NHN41188.1 hypothetical protein [Halorubellus sp. JP-L1]